MEIVLTAWQWLMQWLARHLAEAMWALFWAFIIWAASDLASVDSRIRAGNRHLRNFFAELSAHYLRRRIAKLEMSRNALKSLADMAIYLGILRAIIVLLACMSIAGLVIVAENLGVFRDGKIVACCIFAYIIGTGMGVLRFYAADADTKKKFQLLTAKIEKDIASLREKLDQRTR